jgi:ring-1,2-phenylacetyl-CoA epoxidase subunit PaaC
MTAGERAALSEHILALADDELILGHRDSEWTGHAPILEEDIAFSNIAQDEIGHASLWYGLVHDLTGQSADDLVFFRDADSYRNIQMVELPRGDWAFTIMRQYLFDAAESVRLARLADSSYTPMAEVAAKVRTEEIYHYRHSLAWVKRLGLGTPESSRRLQAALDSLWPYALQLFVPQPGDAQLAAEGVLPTMSDLQQDWAALVEPVLLGARLTVPDRGTPAAHGRHEHTPHMKTLLDEMQKVARMEAPGTEW